MCVFWCSLQKLEFFTVCVCFLSEFSRLSVCCFFKCTVILQLLFISKVLCLSLTTDSSSGLFSAPGSNLTTSHLEQVFIKDLSVGDGFDMEGLRIASF